MRAAGICLSVALSDAGGTAHPGNPRMAAKPPMPRPQAVVLATRKSLRATSAQAWRDRFTYRRSPTSSKTIRNNNQFHDAESNRYYRMVEREGKFYQQRFELDENGRETNLLEVEITHVIGSGNHARSYLHMAPSGELTELPITWYPQERRWAMSPRLRTDPAQRVQPRSGLRLHVLP